MKNKYKKSIKKWILNNSHKISMENSIQNFSHMEQAITNTDLKNSEHIERSYLKDVGSNMNSWFDDSMIKPESVVSNNLNMKLDINEKVNN